MALDIFLLALSAVLIVLLLSVLIAAVLFIAGYLSIDQELKQMKTDRPELWDIYQNYKAPNHK